MKIVKTDGAPEIVGLPKGDELLFFAKIDDLRGYCIISYPKKERLLEDVVGSELWDATVAFGHEDEEMQIYEVSHGHRYSKKFGGGMMITKIGKIIFHSGYGADKEQPSTFEGVEIQNVFFVI
ncbi:hypothetical protein KKD19_02985 [Patescibacteria group bacterium]|nr:hypothetical protein [Patescibacteria group bacterium]MCG2693487.1 hypothetical protein [Candidatus Parcubacteria bacterium]